MYLITEIIDPLNVVDTLGNFKIIDHFYGRESDARDFLEVNVREYIKKNFGETGLSQFKITEIIDDKLTSIVIPVEYGVYGFKKPSHPEIIYIYRKYIKTNPNSWFSSTIDSFECLCMYKLINYEKIKISDTKKTEDVSSEKTIKRDSISADFGNVLSALKGSIAFRNGGSPSSLEEGLRKKFRTIETRKENKPESLTLLDSLNEAFRSDNNTKVSPSTIEEDLKVKFRPHVPLMEEDVGIIMENISTEKKDILKEENISGSEEVFEDEIDDIKFITRKIAKKLRETHLNDS